MKRRRPRSTLFPSTTLFRSRQGREAGQAPQGRAGVGPLRRQGPPGQEQGAPPALRRDGRRGRQVPQAGLRDRKSTRLNSSHANISYAVFCLKKKPQRSGNERCPTTPPAAPGRRTRSFRPPPLSGRRQTPARGRSPTRSQGAPPPRAKVLGPR